MRIRRYFLAGVYLLMQTCSLLAAAPGSCSDEHQQTQTPVEIGATGKLSNKTIAAAVAADPLLSEALKDYKIGNLSAATSLLMKDLKEKPNSGVAHYYLGCVLKDAGADSTAINELETAIKLCPGDALQALAEQAYHGDFKDDEQPGSHKVKGAAQNQWWSPIYNFFQPPVSNKEKNSGADIEPSFPAMPDMFGGLQDAVRQLKSAVKSGTKYGGSSRAPGQSTFSHRFIGDQEVIHMDEMLSLVDESHSLPVSLQSDLKGVVRFPQAPEETVEWDAWIKRFRKTFDNVLFRHLAKECTNEKDGEASIIFSVDSSGHLRSAVYATTADATLVNCILEATKELNRSYVLAFPSNSHISGWNFRIERKFKGALAFINSVRQMKLQAIESAKLRYATTRAVLKQMQSQNELKAKGEKLVDSTAIAKTEAKIKQKPTVAKAPPQLVVKTGVAGLILQKPKPVELKASQLKLSDMPPIESIKMSDEEIDDISIRAGSNVSKLFR